MTYLFECRLPYDAVDPWWEEDLALELGLDHIPPKTPETRLRKLFDQAQHAKIKQLIASNRLPVSETYLNYLYCFI